MSGHWRYILPLTLFLSCTPKFQDQIKRPEHVHTLPNINRLERIIDSSLVEVISHGMFTEDQRISIALYDLEKDSMIISYNENVEMMTGSMFKPFVALAYMHEVSAGRKRLGRWPKILMDSMLVASDNYSTNDLITAIGSPKKITDILWQNYPDIFQHTYIREKIPLDKKNFGRTYKNTTSASDCVRFLRALWRRELPHSDHMLSLMARSRGKRIRGYNMNLVKFYNKTGSTARTCADMGIFEAKDEEGHTRSYILVEIIDRSERAKNYDAWISQNSQTLKFLSTNIYTQLRNDARLP